MKMLKHPNIVQHKETFEDEKHAYLVMELCAGGELLALILESGQHSEGQAARIMLQVCQALEYMHSQGVCHRDIKHENILFERRSSIEDNSIKIVDFGLACKWESGEVLKEATGTLLYMAPQVLECRYDISADLWSCGVLLYVLLCGYAPFPYGTEQQMVTCIRRGNFSFAPADWAGVSEDAKALIRSLLKMNPHDRFTAKQACGHSWLKGGWLTGYSGYADLRPSLTSMRRFISETNITREGVPAIPKPLALGAWTLRQIILNSSGCCNSQSGTQVAVTAIPVDPVSRRGLGEETPYPEVILDSPPNQPLPEAEAGSFLGIVGQWVGLPSGPIAVGDSVEYWSASRKLWIESLVSDVNEFGEIELEVKPRVWIRRAEQAQAIRRF